MVRSSICLIVQADTLRTFEFESKLKEFQFGDLLEGDRDLVAGSGEFERRPTQRVKELNCLLGGFGRQFWTRVRDLLVHPSVCGFWNPGWAGGRNTPSRR